MAEHLAKRALIWVDMDIIETLYNAWSRENAVDILFPSKNWPNREDFLNWLKEFRWENFNPNDTNQNRRSYAYMYYSDPYEAKRKLFSLFEDIFSVDRTWNESNSITFTDVDNHFNVLFEESLWNYKTMMKKVLYDTVNPENSYAMWRYLDLLNQPNKNRPNENYARELLQLFLMLEYKPREDAETPWAIRNYTEEDVLNLSFILTWFRALENKKVFFDINNHNETEKIEFLDWPLFWTNSFPFYTGTWVINNTEIVNSIWWNNWLWDNIIDYIFAKRQNEISYFLAWRILKHYLSDNPTSQEIISLWNKLVENNFELYPTIKWFFTSDIFYKQEYIEEIRYKNPLELVIWTLKLLHSKDSNFIVSKHLEDQNILANLDFVPYNPRSIFWRGWFIDNSSFMNAYFHNTWTTFTSNIAFRSWEWYFDLENILPTKRLTNIWEFNFKTNPQNIFSGSVNLSNITIKLSENIFTIEENLEWEIIINTWWIIEDETDSIVDDKINQESLQAQDEIFEEEENMQIDEDFIEVQSENIKTNEESIEVQSEDENMQTETSFINLFKNFILPKAHAWKILSENEIFFATWTIIFPDFYIQTNSWKINIEWYLNHNSNTLEITSWEYINNWLNHIIENINFNLDDSYKIERDYSIDEIIDLLEKKFYYKNILTTDIRDKLKNYLLYDHNWNQRHFLPNNTTYRDKYIRWLISIMLSQPEFLLLSGHKKQEVQKNTSGSLINDNSKKLILIELFWWYDWIHWIVPKDEYNYYKEIRWSLAFNKNDMIDLGNFYLNKSFERFMPFYNSGDLRIINRVWTPNHSRAHDSAAIQIASQKSMQTIWTPWLIWELIKYDQNPLNNIVLWTSRPPIFTNGRYVNIWSNSILYRNNIWWTNANEKNHQLNTIKDILNNRDYPWNIWDNFKNSIKLDDVWSLWQDRVWWNLASRLNFTKNLIDNWIWTTFYIPGWWWYDTHANQLIWNYTLQERISDVANDVWKFFEDIKKANINATIVIYSEFWRTLKENWWKWTDHWQWWGYFILTTNNQLKNNLPDKIIWNISLEKEHNDWLWVWIDYRSIFSLILKSLYNVDVKKYFTWDFDLNDDLDDNSPELAFKRIEFANSWWSNIDVNFRFKVEDKNFRFRDWSYINFYHWTSEDDLREFSKWRMSREVYDLESDSYNIRLWLRSKDKYYYRLELVDNQYNSYTTTWSFIVPEKKTNNDYKINLKIDTFFTNFNNTNINNEYILENDKKIILIENPIEEIITETESWSIVSYSWSIKEIDFDWIKMIFWTWNTYIEKLRWNNVWNWWFLIPRIVNPDEVLSKKIDFLENKDIKKIMKVWADTLWVGMELNQEVWFKINIDGTKDNLKLKTSEDLENWSQVEFEIIWNDIVFNTKHFSYFLIYDDTVVIESIPENEEWDIENIENENKKDEKVVIVSRWSWGWWSRLVRDICPNWDFSQSYYDGTCEAENIQVEETNRMMDNDWNVKYDREYYANIKKQILERAKINGNLKESNDINYEDKQKANNKKDVIDISNIEKNTIYYNWYTILQIPWSKENNIIEKIYKRIIDLNISKSKKDIIIERINNFFISRNDYIINRTSRNKKKYKKDIILLRSVTR